MRKVAAVHQIHRKQGVAGRKQGFLDGHIGRGAGKGLHVGVDRFGRSQRRGEGFGGAAAGQGLDDIHQLRALIKAAVGVAAIIGQLLADIAQTVFL